MPRIRRGSNFFSLQDFIVPALDLLPCLQARGTRDCNKGSKNEYEISWGSHLIRGPNKT